MVASFSPLVKLGKKFMERFGEKLRALRKGQGLTMQQLAAIQ